MHVPVIEYGSIFGTRSMIEKIVEADPRAVNTALTYGKAFPIVNDPAMTLKNT